MCDIRSMISSASSIIQNAQLYLNQALQPKNLGSAEANVLMFLYTNGDHVIQDAVVVGVEVSKPAISRTIRSLERKGYITRKPNPADRRAKLICLTEKARQEEEFIQRVYEDFLAIAAHGIPVSTIKEFTELFQRVSENIESFRRSQGIEQDK